MVEVTLRGPRAAVNDRMGSMVRIWSGVEIVDVHDEGGERVVTLHWQEPSPLRPPAPPQLKRKLLWWEVTGGAS